jgi:transposase-like protein
MAPMRWGRQLRRRSTGTGWGWAEALVDRARSEGVALTGEGGLLTSMVREVLQTGLDVEMADHLGYEPYEAIGRGSGNSRNGAYAKTVRTDARQRLVWRGV